MKVGVLALQGASREHAEVVLALGADPVPVRRPEHLAGIGALLLPGGESTTMTRLLVSSGLLEPLAEMIRDGLPVLGTCAGAILLAGEVLDRGPRDAPLPPAPGSLAVLDCSVRRNGYGTQLESFEAPLVVDGLSGSSFPGVFIRAPLIERVGAGVDVLAERDGHAVLVRRDNAWAATFHPELSGDLRLHQWFLAEAASGRAGEGER